MIRKHNVKDLETIMDIWYESSSIAHSFLDKMYVEKVKKDMRELYIPNSDTWIHEDNGVAKGFISMIDNEIAGLFVTSEQQSKGVGTQLVDFVNQFNTELRVDVFKENNIGKAFYYKYGFTVFKEDLHEESGQVVLSLIFNEKKE